MPRRGQPDRIEMRQAFFKRAHKSYFANHGRDPLPLLQVVMDCLAWNLKIPEWVRDPFYDLLEDLSHGKPLPNPVPKGKGRHSNVFTRQRQYMEHARIARHVKRQRVTCKSLEEAYDQVAAMRGMNRETVKKNYLKHQKRKKQCVWISPLLAATH